MNTNNIGQIKTIIDL